MIYLETIVILLIVCYLLLHASGTDSPQKTLPFLGLIAAFGLRVMPMVNRVLGSLQAIRYSWPAVALLSSELRGLGTGRDVDQSAAPPQHIDLTQQIELRNVCFQYPGLGEAVLRNISLTVTKGAFVALIGNSGSGKTTLVDILLGLLQPSSGGIYVDGVTVSSTTSSWQALIGYVPQSVFLTDDSIRRNVAFGVDDSDIDDTKVVRALAKAQLSEFVATLEDGIDSYVGERGSRLSGGQRQRLGIARALYFETRILVMDEATSALDGETERFVLDAVLGLRGAQTIIFITHRLTSIMYCDKVFRLEGGVIAASGTPQEVLAAYTDVPN
jgi:ABC-type multidrug transport system fused ATPase/permease subunit